MSTISTLSIMDKMVKLDNQGIHLSTTLVSSVKVNQGAIIGFGVTPELGNFALNVINELPSDYMFMCLVVDRRELEKIREELKVKQTNPIQPGSYASPRTIGELRNIIEDLPDEIPFGFRNQPFQVLYHEVVNGDSFLSFTPEKKEPGIDIFNPLTIPMQLAILRNIQKDLSDSEIKYANWTFVNKYLLYHTPKSGRTSAYAHCELLGIDPDGNSFW